MLKHSIPGLLARVVNRPLMASPAMARFYFSYLTARRGLDASLLEDGAAMPAREIVAVGKYGFQKGGPAVPMVPGTGIAAIEVTGSLTHKLGSITPSSGMTGYDGIEAQLDAALSDPTVKGIMLDIHSGGGEVNGAFDLANRIAAANKVKPVWAIADENAFSAAYLLASQASRITTPQTGQVGSIGVIAVHMDQSRALANEGVEATVIKAGAQKDAYSSLGPLSADTLDKLQGEINDAYQMFVGAVANGRGMTQQSVRDTEAGIYSAPEAQKLGLIDAVQPANDTFAEFAAKLAQPQRTYSIPAPSPAGPLSGASAKAEKEGEMPEQKPAPAVETQPAIAPAAALAAVDPALAERKRVVHIQTMAQAGEETLRDQMIADGSTVDVAVEAFRQARENKRLASVALRRAETPQPVRAAVERNGGAAVLDAASRIDVAAVTNRALEAWSNGGSGFQARHFNNLENYVEGEKAAAAAEIEWNESADIRAEFRGNRGDYVAYRRAEGSGKLAKMGSAKFGVGKPFAAN